MAHLRIPLLAVLLFLVNAGQSSGDEIITLDGNELSGKIVEISGESIRYIPGQSSSTEPVEIAKHSVFMVKYDDGRKEVFNAVQPKQELRSDRDNRKYSACVFLETGLFGLVNIDERDFDPGVVTIGVTPSIDRRLNSFLSVGMEYMVIWAMAKKAEDARFIMNCNALARLSFPLNHRLDFLTQINAGLSIWPGAESVHPVDSTFFNDRIGWDIHGGLGLEYKTMKNSSIVFYAGYNANFSMVHETPITIDMLILSIGPKIKF